MFIKQKHISGEYAVLVNTRHADIREHLSTTLTQAMAYMQEGYEFCLKVLLYDIPEWNADVKPDFSIILNTCRIFMLSL